MTQIGDSYLNEGDLKAILEELEEELEDLEREKGSIEDDWEEAKAMGRDSSDIECELDSIEAEIDETETKIAEIESALEDFSGTLIHEDAFKDYAIETSESIHGSHARAWPFNCLDWDVAAEALKADYTTVNLQDNTYYKRA